MSQTGVYRTESGMIFRVFESEAGHLAAETLKDTGWVPAPIGVVGLRVAATTVQLTASQVLALPH
jgi:hypothetical protein